MSDTLLSRFLRYVQIDTQSDETSKTFPSTSGQLFLLNMLKQELSELGAADVQMTRHGYVVASIPANTRKARVPTVAFLAHVDTAPDCSGKNVKPIVHRKYDGGKGQRDGERGLSGGQTSGSAAARTLRAGDNRRAGRIHSPHPCRRPDRADRREISPARLRA